MKPTFLLIAMLLIPLAGCSDDDELAIPAPINMTADALGHYCQMNLLEHVGPKAQIHIARVQHPIWFSQVRDAIAFLRMPEETAPVAAIYVHDMGRAKSWDNPGADIWIDARKAYFVIEGRKRGGMGAPEAVPFGSRTAAQAYVSRTGGKIVSLKDIPDSYVLSPVEISLSDIVIGTRS